MSENLKVAYGVYDLPRHIDQNQIWFEYVGQDIGSYTVNKYKTEEP